MTKPLLQILKISEVDGALEEDNSSLQHSERQINQLHHPQESQTLQDNSFIMEGAEYQSLSNSRLKSSTLSQNKQMENTSLTAEQLSHYFENKSNELSNKQYSPSDLTLLAEQKIHKQIQEGKLIIVRSKQHLNPKKSQVDPNQLKFTLQNKKQEIIQQLKHIQHEQLKLIKQTKSKSQPKPVFKLTEQDKQHLIQLVKSKKQFQQSLQLKDQQLLQQKKLQQLKQQKQTQSAQQLANQQKQQKIFKKLKEIETQFQKRTEMIKQSPHYKSVSYVYKRNQIKEQIMQKKEEKDYKEKLERIKQQHELDLENIKTHQKTYSLSLSRRTNSVSIPSQSLPKRQKTAFDLIVQQELQQHKQNNQSLKLKILQREFRSKINQYQENVDQFHKPKTDPNIQNTMVQSQTFQIPRLSKEERIEKGLEYLARAKEMKKSNSTPLTTEKSKTTVSSPTEHENMYINYLKQEVPFNPLKKQFTELISGKEDNLNFEAALRAKYLAQGIEAKSKKGKDSRIFHGMKNKLKLLENLY